MITKFEETDKHQGLNGALFCDDCGGMIFKDKGHECIITDAICPICELSISNEEYTKIGTCEECSKL